MLSCDPLTESSLSRPDAANAEKLRVEAHARIIWGESPNAVRASLREAGCSDLEVDQTVRAALRERAVWMRKRGVWDLAVGATLIGMSAGVVAITVLVPRCPGGGKVWAIMALLGGYGIWRLTRGIERVLLGSRA
jgi:hypothetical protein